MEQQETYQEKQSYDHEIVRQLPLLRTTVIVAMPILVIAVAPFFVLGAGVITDWYSD